MNSNHMQQHRDQPYTYDAEWKKLHTNEYSLHVSFI